MRLDYVTIFPEYLDALGVSLPGKAVEKGLLELHVHDLRTWTTDRHRTVDDTPYGGGAGMVLKPEPFGEALDALAVDGATVVVPTPAGRPFTQAMARDLATRERLVFLCGRYEGIDQRVLDHVAERAELVEVSLGDYVLNGGEVAALAVTEAVVRLLPGFMGNPDSLTEESHTDGLLEYPVYTKPASWRGLDVPEVLLSGDHGAVARWRLEQSRRRTAQRRPDLLAPADLTGVPPEVEGQWRPATRADAGELLTLQRACWVDEALAADWLGVPALHESLADVVTDLGRWETWVLRSSGRLVASGRGQLSDDGETWTVGRLMVAPDLRGRGIGRWLLARIEERAPDSVQRLELVTGAANRRNQRMYQRAGYRRSGPVGEHGLRMTRPRRA